VNEAPSDWITLRSAELSAAIQPLGAQLSLLRDRAGRDLLWNGDARFWSGRAPLLFPIVGALHDGGYRVAGQRYALGRHGFARNRMFEVISSSVGAATFRLRSSAETLAMYPFDFELEVRFVLEGAALDIEVSLRNPRARELLASFGFHPAFRWPLPFGQSREAHSIEFESDEPDGARRIDAQGLLLPERVPSPLRERHLALDDALFADDVLIFDRVRSRRVLFGGRSGPRLDIHFPDTPFLGVWSKPGAPFVCIEPWHGITDPQGFTGDFRDKPGVFPLAAGGVKRMRMSISLGA